MIRLLKRTKAYIAFSSEYLVGLSTIGAFKSFDIYKYKRIRDKLLKDKLINRKNIVYPQPCSFSDMRLVHTDKYIRKIQDPVFVNQSLKIELNSSWDNSVLEYYRAVCGGTICATFKALDEGKPVFNFGGGFHHAHPDKAEGLCLLNDVAIAIKKIRESKKVDKFLVIDLDYHQGNGTAIIFKDDENVFTFSVHADCWNEFNAKANLDIFISSEISDEHYMKIIIKHVPHILDTFSPHFVFYIAGSDPYEYDTLADMHLGRKTMLQRNLFVFNEVTDRKIPLVILPGGGYGSRSWEIYYDFLVEILK